MKDFIKQFRILLAIPFYKMAHFIDASDISDLKAQVQKWEDKLSSLQEEV